LYETSDFRSSKSTIRLRHRLDDATRGTVHCTVHSFKDYRSTCLGLSSTCLPEGVLSCVLRIDLQRRYRSSNFYNTEPGPGNHRNNGTVVYVLFCFLQYVVNSERPDRKQNTGNYDLRLYRARQAEESEANSPRVLQFACLDLLTAISLGLLIRGAPVCTVWYDRTQSQN
jgi:hypothetical protein